jgi:hypothetical protein
LEAAFAASNKVVPPASPSQSNVQTPPVTCMSRNPGTFRARGASPHEIRNWIRDDRCADVGRVFSRRSRSNDSLFVAGRNRPSSRSAALAWQQAQSGRSACLGASALRLATHSVTGHAATAGRRSSPSSGRVRRARAAAGTSGYLQKSFSAGSHSIGGGQPFGSLASRWRRIP